MVRRVALITVLATLASCKAKSAPASSEPEAPPQAQDDEDAIAEACRIFVTLAEADENNSAAGACADIVRPLTPAQRQEIIRCTEACDDASRALDCYVNYGDADWPGAECAPEASGAKTLTKEQALAKLSNDGTKQLGNWINVHHKGGDWHFDAKWKGGSGAYYVVDGATGEVLYSNPDTGKAAVPEHFVEAKAQASFHIVDHGITPTKWVEESATER